jgi:hypothetical protein
LARRSEVEYKYNKSVWRKIGEGLFWMIKGIGKGIWWLAMKWWHYIDQIGSMNPQDFQKKPATPIAQTGTNKIETKVIDGITFYKDKDGNWRKMHL